MSCATSAFFSVFLQDLLHMKEQYFPMLHHFHLLDLDEGYVYPIVHEVSWTLVPSFSSLVPFCCCELSAILRLEILMNIFDFFTRERTGEDWSSFLASRMVPWIRIEAPDSNFTLSLAENAWWIRWVQCIHTASYLLSLHVQDTYSRACEQYDQQGRVTVEKSLVVCVCDRCCHFNFSVICGDTYTRDTRRSALNDNIQGVMNLA